VELSWTGESKELSSGNSWAVNCEEGDVGDKMVIEVDVTKFRVQPFRSYKVCINLEDSPTNSHLDEVCSHLFSFEKYVPYRPEEEETEVKEDINKLVENNDYKAVKKTEMESLDDLISVINKENKESEHKDIFIEKNETKTSEEKHNNINEGVLKNQLQDIKNYVRDDFKSDFFNAENKIIEEIDFALKYSYSETFCLSFLLLLCSLVASMFL